MAKRIFHILLAFLLVVNLAVPAWADAEAEVVLTLNVDDEDKQIKVGETITVTVGCTTSPNNIAGFELTVNANKEDFELISVDTTLNKTDTFASNGKIAFDKFSLDSQFSLDTVLATIVLEAKKTTDASAISISAEAAYFDEDYNDLYYNIDLPSAVTMKITETAAEPPAVVEGYSVSVTDAEKPINVNGEASVQVKVAHSDDAVENYNAYDLTITYPVELQYVSATGPDTKNFSVTHDEPNRTIHVLGYGADKDFDVPVVTLEFTGLAVGDHNVTVTSAKVDAAAKASLQDAPSAAITDADGKITVTGYTVTLDGEGLSADSTTAIPGQVYTFKAADDKYYNYTITATIGEKTIDIEDNDTGIYTIAAEEITGNFTITATRTEKEYDVTINHIVDGETTSETLEKATYNKPYEFTPVKAGYKVDAVTYAIGTGAAESLSGEEGKYTIPAEKVTGAIVINITWKAEGGDEPDPDEKTVNVTKPDYVIGDKTATKGEDYQFSFQETAKYDYSDLKITVGDKELEKDKDYTGPDENGEYTILGAAITGDINIEVTQNAKYTIDVNQYVTLNNKDKAEDEKVSMYLVTVSGVPEGYVAKYAGSTMYWSEKDENAKTGYGAYAYLVISTEGETDFEKTAAKVVSVVEKATGDSDPVSVNYNGNVNGTVDAQGNAVIDVNDAQLVYNMYMAAYDDFGTANMEMFLRADMNATKTVETADAAAIIDIIKG